MSNVAIHSHAKFGHLILGCLIRAGVQNVAKIDWQDRAIARAA